MRVDVEIATHIAAIAENGKLLAANAEQAGLDAAVPACPGWDAKELLRHLSEIHLWAAAQVTNRATKMWPDGLADIELWWPERAVFWPADDELVDYYLTTNTNLVEVLDAAPADLECRTFLAAPSPLAMWARRQAHETAIHRYDAEQANGEPTAFMPEFAADGLDELLVAFGSRWSSYPVAETHTMRIDSVDTGDSWHLILEPDGITALRGSREASDAIVSGTASDLYVALWNREDGAELSVQGDRSLLETWQTKSDIRWD